MEWQPIETAPQTGEPVLLCIKAKDGEFQDWPQVGSFRRYGAGTEKRWVTHHALNGWMATHRMPLPAPPAGA